MGYRLIYLILALLLLGIYISGKRETNSLTIGGILFWIFWIIYAIRIIYDTAIANIELYDNLPPSYFYLFAFGGCFAPSACILLLGRQINYEKIASQLFYLYLIVGILIVSYYVSQKGLGAQLFNERVGIENATKNKRVLNVITMSLNGVYLFSLSLLNLLMLKSTSLRWRLSFLGILIGLLVLFLGASRGPSIALVLALVFILFYHFNTTRQKLNYIFVFPIILLGLFAMLNFYVLPNVDFQSIQLFARFSDMFEQDYEEERNYLLEIGLNDFSESPIFGKHFLIMWEGQGGFVHNIFVEVLHSTGIIGAIFYFPIYFIIFNNIWKCIKTRNWLIYPIVMFLITLTFSSTSGALYVDAIYWVQMALMLTITPNAIRKAQIYISTKPIQKPA
jgi:oligosaccharide repeat unit polymerase